MLSSDTKYMHGIILSVTEVSWILSMWPNIYPNVDGEVAYAVNPITGLPMVTFKSSLNASTQLQ